jgi:hypothetical protein
MVATMFLRDAFYMGTALAPFRREQAAAAVGRGFFEAGRFGEDQGAEGCEHLAEAGRQGLQQFLGGMGLRHGPHMLAAQGTTGNTARAAAAGHSGLQGLIRATTGAAAYRGARGSHIIIGLPDKWGAAGWVRAVRLGSADDIRRQ